MASTASLDVADGPVMSLISKRLRTLCKKMNPINAMEDSVSQGKSFNKEQEEVLINELEKLRQPLASALAKELEASVAHTRCDAETLAENSGSRRPQSRLLDICLFCIIFRRPQSRFQVQNKQDVAPTKKEEDDDNWDLPEVDAPYISTA
uniref:Uncharacterized protein n=1 Tax=Cajanus cajan TaxID=3821 RepID=A0A151SAR9_CAJCA|nr:hypothetical protein KK1_026261 [Cajanus cajan]